ncbi:MAG: hypothetical protein HY291_13815 [Planctomycetes bacterium]|nr:hypothetical protein [Planctomycetota bacterium]
MKSKSSRRKNVHPFAGIKRATPESVRKMSKKEWGLRVKKWVGSLKDDATAERDMEWILNDRRRYRA